MTDIGPVFLPPNESRTDPAAPSDEPLVNATPDTPAPEQDYEFVRMPSGELRAILKSDIVNASDVPATSKSEVAASAATVVPAQHFYVHLADGSVERVTEEDLPVRAGTNAQFGHWQRDGKVYDVIGVYPVESDAQKS